MNVIKLDKDDWIRWKLIKLDEHMIDCLSNHNHFVYTQNLKVILTSTRRRIVVASSRMTRKKICTARVRLGKKGAACRSSTRGRRVRATTRRPSTPSIGRTRWRGTRALCRWVRRTWGRRPKSRWAGSEYTARLKVSIPTHTHTKK